ncbi:MAG: hypothetical protein ACLGXA_13095 [Acidobacteriota bacterium]
MAARIRSEQPFDDRLLDAERDIIRARLTKRLPIYPNLYKFEQIRFQRQLRIPVLISLQIKMLRMLPYLLTSLSCEDQQVRTLNR